MRKSPVKVMILTADAGFGHRSAANAVAEALRLQYGEAVETVIANPLDSKQAPFLLRDSQSDYDRWVKQVPELYKFGYEASETLIPTRVLEEALGVLLYEAIKEVFTLHKPDVVLTTYPMYQAPLSMYFKNRRSRVPFFTVITDLSTVHRLWFHRKVDGCLVPNQFVAEMAASNQVPVEKITITGIPVYPDITLETRSVDEIRTKLGWQLQIPTLLAVGSKRTDKLFEALNVVNHYGAPLQLAVVAGKNDELYGELKKGDWHIPVHIYNYVHEIPMLMRASDLIICKAGGLIVTESLACGLPMILTEVIPGQETGNAEYVRAAKAGVVVNSSIEMLESLHHLMKDDQALLKKFAANACAQGKPDSAFKVATLLWEAAGARMEQKSTRRTHHLRPAIES